MGMDDNKKQHKVLNSLVRRARRSQRTKAAKVAWGRKMAAWKQFRAEAAQSPAGRAFAARQAIVNN
jgi:hypothetical protein